MQQSVVPQVGVVQSVLGSFAVVPEGQEKLTLPQVALTVRGYTHSHTHKDFSRCPLSILGTWARPHSAERPTVRNQKKRKEKEESSEDQIVMKLPVKQNQKKRRRER